MDELAGIVDEIASTRESNGAFGLACAKISAWEQVADALRARAAQDFRDRNALLPVHQLPVEVLASILEAAVAEGFGLYYYQRLKGLRGVCYRWQKVVDDVPSLWTRIRGSDSSRLVEEALKKSSTRLLDVYFRSEIYFQPDKLAAFGKKLEPHLNRLKNVDISYYGSRVPEGWFTAIKLLTSPQPSLERFSFSDKFLRTNLSKLALFADHAPRLKDLHLHGIDVDCRGTIFGRLSRMLLPLLRSLSLQNLSSTLKERLLRDIQAPQCAHLRISLQAGSEESEDPGDFITRHLPKWLFGETPFPPEITRLDMKITESRVNLALYDSELSERFHLYLSHDESVDISRAVLTGIGAVLKSHVQKADMNLTLRDTALHLAEDGNYVEQLRRLSQVTMLELGELWSCKYCESDGAQNFQLPVFPRLQSVSFYQQPSEWIIKVVPMLSAHPKTKREGGGIMVNIYVRNDSEVEEMGSAVEGAKGIVGPEHVVVSVNPEWKNYGWSS
ncbi:hypothetical protein FS837_007359 [Tulasnella sp. UAMH 9824]|nr:hypothetical protein FS837_007359 [Tulasnella sp. UAMH 9824]